MRRHRQEVFVSSPFALARQRDRGRHHHGQGEDHRQKTGHDIVLGVGFRIVETVHYDVERRRRGGAHRQWPGKIVAQCGTDETGDGGNGIGGGGRIGRIGLDQQRRPRAAHQIAREIDRDVDDEGNSSLGQHPAGFRRRVRRLGDIEIAGIAERGDDGIRERAGIGDRHRRRQMPGHHVDGVAEDEKLHQRNAHEHCQRQPVAAHLDEFLAQHGNDAGQRETSAHALPLPLSCCSSMKTSSMLGAVSRTTRLGSWR